MKDKFVPKIKLRADIFETQIDTLNTPKRLENVHMSEEIPKFKEVFSGLLENVDKTVKAPDQVMEDHILGNGADIHDVMIAMSKAELAINLSTQVTTKVVQAYEKVMSIQL